MKIDLLSLLTGTELLPSAVPGKRGSSLGLFCQPDFRFKSTPGSNRACRPAVRGLPLMLVARSVVQILQESRKRCSIY